MTAPGQPTSGASGPRVKLSCPFPRAHPGPLPLNFISGLRIFRRGQVRETSISLNCTRVVPALAKVIASIRLWSRRPATFGLVRSDDLVGQMGRRGTTFWKSDFELEAGELEIAAHRGLST
jgi:hypothetical protein